MALTVTATPDPITGSVRLVIDGGTPPYVLDASPGGDRPDYRVRTTYATVPGDPAARIAVDGDIPLNTPTVYVATDTHGSQGQSAPVTVASTRPILSDATDPSRALPVVVVRQPPNEWESRSVWWDVLGARAPFASIGPLRFRSGDLVLRVEDRTARAALVALLSTGNPVVLRSTIPDNVDDVVALVERVRDELVVEDAPGGPRLFTLTYQAIARELGPYAVDPGRSYGAVLDSYSSYGVVLGTYATYDALRAGDPGAGLGANLLPNGDFSAGMSGWELFWTGAGVSWDTNDGTGRATAADPGTSYAAMGWKGLGATSAGRRYRVTGRVRSSVASSTTRLDFLTNTAAEGGADYFEPGTAVSSTPITSGPAWSSFVCDVTVPTGDDVASFYFRADNLVAGAVVEWDDLVIRERTG